MLKRLLNIAFFGVLISFPPEASADVNVAVVAPQSGSREMFGRELWEGAQIAVNELNEKCWGERKTMLGLTGVNSDDEYFGLNGATRIEAA